MRQMCDVSAQLYFVEYNHRNLAWLEKNASSLAHCVWFVSSLVETETICNQSDDLGKAAVAFYKNQAIIC